jgi:cytochrome P450
MKRHRDPGRRSGAARHISFGFGIHLCVCHRLAEMQPRVLREEIPKRGRTIEVVGEPERVPSNFVRGYSSLPVRVRA